MKIEYISTFRADVTAVAEFLDAYPHKAKRIFEKLDKILMNLMKMPKMYPVYEDVPVFRVIAIEEYLVFYAIVEEKDIIEIHRLIYGGMDLE